MANKKEISVQVNVGANLENIQKRLGGLQEQLNKLSLPASVRNEFLGLFSGMEKELDKITQKTAGGKFKIIDSASVEKSIEKIDSLYSALIAKFESRGIATAALKQDQNAISAITGALKVYADSTKTIVSEEKKLTAEIQKQEKAKDSLLEKHKQQKVVSDAELAAQKERVSAATKEANAKAKAVTAAREALEKKIAESGGTYKLSDIDKKGSPLRKTKAFKEYKAATEASGIANKQKKAESEKFASMTTLEQQKKDIQEIEIKITKAKDKLQEFNATLKATKETEAFEEVKRQLTELENIDFGKYGIDISEINNIEQLEEALKQVRAEAEKASQAFGQELKTGLKKVEPVIEETEKEIKQASNALEEFDEREKQADALSTRIKQFLGLSGAAQVMRSALRDAMQTITELDATMTEMAVVTDLSVGDYWNQLPQYSKQASELGVSINDAYKAATLYYQQGLKSNEVTKISAETLKMARIAGLSAEDATNKMTAALRGFNMELNETSAQKVSDVYSELAAITASDVDEISSAMTKTASIASSAGMEFETTAAFLSQIIETTRESAETAGTALKTVIARFQELKKDPSEIGEVDGEVVDANKIETALRSVGVALRDSSGQFRDLDDVFLELSKKWDTLDTNTQRYIATIAAGSRQQSRFIAMMSDYGRTQELVAAANNSTGASNKQFEKTMDSLESKLEKLKNAWHEFTMGIVNSDLVKTGVDILTKLLEIINKATSSLGSFGNSITKIMGVFAIFKLGQKIFDKFKQPIFNLFTNIANEAGNKGYLAGKNWAREAERGAKDQINQTDNASSPQTNEEIIKQKKQSPGIGGWRAFKEAHVANKEVKAARNILNSSEYQNAAANAKVLEENHVFGEQGEVYRKSKASGQLTLLSKQDANAVKTRYAQLNKQAKAYAKAEEDFAKSSAKKWDSISQGIGAAGEAVSAIGIGISLLGGAMQSIGLEEQGEAWSKLGQWITLAGGAISALVPILQLVQTVATAAKISMAAAFGWVALAVTAVVALGAIIYTTINKIQSSSPEGKLKAAREEAEAAANAADRAAESYNNLKNSLDELKDGYKTLKELTRGTSEWNEAVNSINNTVLDLIQEYPELAEFVKAESGVLTLDIDSAGVQEILVKAQTVSVATQNTSKRAEMSVMQAEKVKEIGVSAGVDALATKKRDEIIATNVAVGAVTGAGAGAVTGAGIGSGIGAGIGAVVGALIGWGRGAAQGELEANAIRTDEQLQENIAEASKALAKEGKAATYENLLEAFKTAGINPEDAAILAEEYAKDAKGFKALGDKLNAFDEAVESYSASMAETAKTLIQIPDRIKDDVDGQTLFYDVLDTILDKDDYQKFYKDASNDLESGKLEFSEEDRNRIIEQLGGEGAKLEGEKIINSKGEEVLSGVSEEYLRSVFIDEKATERFKNAGEATLDFFERIKNMTPDTVVSDDAITRLFTDKEGLGLFRGDLEKLKEIDVDKVWTEMDIKERDLFENDKEKLREYINSTLSKAYSSFYSADALLETNRLSGGFFGVNAGAAHNLAKVATSGTMLQGEGQQFLNAFNKIIKSNDLTDDQKNTFSSLVAAMNEDPTNREKWDNIIEQLEIMGLDISTGIGKTVADFIETTKSDTDSRYSATYLENMGVSEALISQYNNATPKEIEQFHKTFEKWKKDYNTANSIQAKTEHDLLTKIISALTEQYEKQIEALEELSEATSEANAAIVSAISSQIEETRQQRENDKTEQEIENNRNRLAYLGMDTSGANALEMLDLEKEIATAEQGYQDSLIDQTIAKLEDSNARAEEQRERQIELARQQLDAYLDSDQILTKAQGILNDALASFANGEDLEQTTLGQLLSPTGVVTAFETSEFWSNLNQSMSILIDKANGVDPETQKAQAADKLQTSITSAQGKINSNRIVDLAGSEEIKAMYTDYEKEMKALNLEQYIVSFEDFIKKLTAYVQKNASPGISGRAGFMAAMLFDGDAPHFSTGGIADFTGPAWLDGTKSKPEIVLNQRDSANFIVLRDILAEVLDGTTSTSNTQNTSGDNHFEIEINVEKLENDYDVEQLVNKIRNMIYEDASYRNVNAVGFIR